MKESTKRKKTPEAIGPIIERLVSRLGLEELVKSGRIFATWETLVGPTIARHAKPQAFRQGTLIVRVDSSVWLAQLDRYLKSKIREKINLSLKRPLIKKIVFRVGETAEAVD